MTVLLLWGGGSSHDCGKGIGLVVAHGGRIQDFVGKDRSSRSLPPLIAVNTTAGTASEMTRFCFITDTQRRVKMAIVDWRCMPLVAIDDPLLMQGMPQALTAATGMDALTHAVEAYVSTAATSMTDAAAEKAMELIAHHLRPAVANGDDRDAREGMCYGQYLAGMAFNNAGLGYIHAMAHQLGGFYNLPHGECCAVLLPHVCESLLSSQLDRYARIGYMLGEEGFDLPSRTAAKMTIRGMRTLSTDVGIPATLSECAHRCGQDIREEDIPIMAVHAMKDVCAQTSPKILNVEEVAALYRVAL